MNCFPTIPTKGPLAALSLSSLQWTTTTCELIPPPMEDETTTLSLSSTRVRLAACASSGSSESDAAADFSPSQQQSLPYGPVGSVPWRSFLSQESTSFRTGSDGELPGSSRPPSKRAAGCSMVHASDAWRSNPVLCFWQRELTVLCSCSRGNDEVTSAIDRYTTAGPGRWWIRRRSSTLSTATNVLVCYYKSSHQSSHPIAIFFSFSRMRRKVACHLLRRKKQYIAVALATSFTRFYIHAVGN